MEIEDSYKELGVTPDMPMEQIHSAYRKLCKKYHPDIYLDDDPNKMMAQEKFILIDSAYRMILKQHIDNLETNKRVSNMVELIIRKMDLKIRGMERASFHMDGIFWRQVMGVGALIGTGIVLAEMSPTLGYSIVGLCIIALYYMWRFRN